MRLSVLGRRFRLLHALAAVLAVGTGTWATGCDFTRVDEGADLTTEQHLDALATASTPDQAERAIRGILNKVGVRTPWQADVPDDKLAFGTYSVSDDEIRALAEEHAAFIAGQASAVATLGETHEAVVVADDEAREIVRNLEVVITPSTRGPIVANAEESAAILRASVPAALNTPEDPASAMVLAITADGAALPTRSTAVSADRPLSPAQRFLFSVWDHHNGPFMFPFLSRDLDSLPVIEEDGPEARTGGSTTRWHCDACCGGSGKFTSMTLLYLGPATDVEARILNPTNGLGSFKPFPSTSLNFYDLFTVDGTNRPANGNGLTGTIGNTVGIYNGDGDKFAYIHTSCSVPVYPGDVFGKKIDGVWHKVLVVVVRTQQNGLCSNAELCNGICVTKLVACKFKVHKEGSSDYQQCYDEFRACKQFCHDQGGGGSHR